MQTVDLGHGRGWLGAPAAASLRRVDAQIGHPLQVTAAGRTRARQQYLYDQWKAGKGSYAAKPGTSPHEFGNAIDTNERLVSVLADHGWWRPLKSEPWHFVYRAWADSHLHDPTPAGTGSTHTPTRQEDDMPITILERRNTALTKSLYDVRTGKAIRAISVAENTAFRAEQARNSGAVVYLTVSDAEYKERGGK